MKRKQVLIILITSFLFVVLWIAFNIYHGIITSTIPQNISMQISPISPSFDTKVINNLKQREIVTPIFELNTSSINQTPTPQITPISSQSAKIASIGGNLK